jgi:hypothetical protein
LINVQQRRQREKRPRKTAQFRLAELDEAISSIPVDTEDSMELAVQ